MSHSFSSNSLSPDPLNLKEIQHHLAKNAALLVAFAFLTGLYMSLVAMKLIDAEFQTVLSAHLNALLGAFWLMGVGWSLPFCQAPLNQLKQMSRLMILANWSNWFFTLIKAHLHVAGIQVTSDWVNNSILTALTLFVVLPALYACWIWIRSLHGLAK